MKISIPNPCIQKWEHMTSIANNKKFCSHCSKQITDFSNQTDEQILNYLLSNPIDTCGKFSANQLNRGLGNNEFNFPGLKTLLVAASLTQFSVNSNAQSVQNQIEIHQLEKNDTNYQIIQGNIRDTTFSFQFENQLTLEFPLFKLYCKPDNSTGNFQFTVPKDQLPDSILLIVKLGNSYKTFKNLNPNEFIQLEVSLLPINIETDFTQEMHIIGTIVTKPKWYQFGFKFRRLWYRIFG